MLLEPLVVVRSYTRAFGRRKLDLAELYELRFMQGIRPKDLVTQLQISRGALMSQLRKARVLFEK